MSLTLFPEFSLLFSQIWANVPRLIISSSCRRFFICALLSKTCCSSQPQVWKDDWQALAPPPLLLCCAAELRRNNAESAAAISPLQLWWVGQAPLCKERNLPGAECLCYSVQFGVCACVCSAAALLYLSLSLCLRAVDSGFSEPSMSAFEVPCWWRHGSRVSACGSPLCQSDQNENLVSFWPLKITLHRRFIQSSYRG